MSRYFTLKEAENLLPQVSKLIGEAVAVKPRYQEAEESMQALMQRISLLGGTVVDRESALKNRNERDRASEQLKTALEGIQEFGCVVKDLDIGLIDFPTLFRGEEVYLCWKLGETAIEFWHGVHEGFAGRKPIDSDFLANHRGESPD